MSIRIFAEWDGQALWPKFGKKNPFEKIAKGTTVSIEIKKRRSLKHHKRLFGLIRAAFDLWPEGHEFQPETEDHLRAWLTIKAGHCEVKEGPRQAFWRGREARAGNAWHAPQSVEAKNRWDCGAQIAWGRRAMEARRKEWAAR